MACLVAMGCAAGAEMRPRGKRNAVRIDKLERRVAAVEGRTPGAAPAAHRSSHLDARVGSLEARLARIEDKLDRLAQQPAPSPSPSGYQRPDPNKVYVVPLDDSPAVGPTDAPVTIVASVQFPEPYTHRVWPTLAQLRKDYGRELKMVFKTFVVHPYAVRSSIAACALAYQGVLDPAEPLIYDTANNTPGRQLDDAALEDIAKSLGVNLKQYRRDLATCEAGHKRDEVTLKALGQSGVPAFWINGRMLSGAQPIESFKRVIDDEFAKWKVAKQGGARAQTYYDSLMRDAAKATP